MMANIAIAKKPTPDSMRGPPRGWDPFWLMREMLRWDPFRAMSSMFSSPRRSPPLDVNETEAEYVYTFPLPNQADRERVKTEVRDSQLTVVVAKTGTATPAPAPRPRKTRRTGGSLSAARRRARRG
jgi:HSP20 family molecular chaperone IbpA